MIYVTGDIHGSHSIHKLGNKNFDSSNLTKEDIVIVCGDFGLIWDYKGQNKEEKYWLKWLEDRPFTTCFVDGNHENFDRLNQYEVKEWKGGHVREVGKGIYHLLRGQVFTIEGKTFFTFGGAQSHDRGPLVGDTNRVLGKYWWAKEMPSQSEMDQGRKNLEGIGYKVDYILTHCLPSVYQQKLPDASRYPLNPLTNYLEEIDRICQYTHWYCGHYHREKEVGKISIVYDRIVPIE